MDIKMESPNMVGKVKGHNFQFSSRGYKSQFRSVCLQLNASINIKPAGWGHPGHMRGIWSKSSLWDPKMWSDRIKYPHLGEVISLKFVVVVEYILQSDQSI